MMIFVRHPARFRQARKFRAGIQPCFRRNNAKQAGKEKKLPPRLLGIYARLNNTIKNIGIAGCPLCVACEQFNSRFLYQSRLENR
jgi:hypothetical protein